MFVQIKFLATPDVRCVIPGVETADALERYLDLHHDGYIKTTDALNGQAKLVNCRNVVHMTPDPTDV